MNVLYVHERAAFFGGVEQNIADTARALRRRGVRCHLAHGCNHQPEVDFLELFDSTHRYHDPGQRQPGAADSATLRQIALRVDADCVYFHKVSRLPEGLKPGRYRTVQMVHDHDLYCPRRHKYFSFGSQVCNRPAGWRCYADLAFVERDRQSSLGVRYASIGAKLREMRSRRSLDAFLVASEFMRLQLRQNGFPDSRIYVLPLAVNQAAPVQSPLRPGLPVVVFVGQLIRGKGVDLLLRALAEVKEPFRAVIAGKGNAQHSLQELCRELHLEDKVEFKGWVSNDQLPALYAQARVVAVPSRWPEPFGLVGIEAMSHERPVVAFAVGGIPDWLEHGRNGLLVAEGDVAAMGRALSSLLSDPALAQTLGRAGRTMAQEKFGFARYISDLKTVLLPADDRSAKNVADAVLEARV